METTDQGKKLQEDDYISMSEQNAVHLASPDTYIKCAIQMSVCPSVDKIVSALYLQQYLSDAFHICTSYQAISEGVSGVKFVSKLKIRNF